MAARGASAVSRSVPDRARQLAVELDLRFADDAGLAAQLDDARLQLRRTNDSLWCGLHPDGMVGVYADHPAAVDVAFANNRSEIVGAGDPLREAQDVHWTIQYAFIDCQTAAERRRLVAVEIGELAGELIGTLVAVGCSERDAREANVQKLANGSNTVLPR